MDILTTTPEGHESSRELGTMNNFNIQSDDSILESKKVMLSKKKRTRSIFKKCLRYFKQKPMPAEERYYFFQLALSVVVNMKRSTRLQFISLNI